MLKIGEQAEVRKRALKSQPPSTKFEYLIVNKQQEINIKRYSGEGHLDSLVILTLSLGSSCDLRVMGSSPSLGSVQNLHIPLLLLLHSHALSNK